MGAPVAHDARRLPGLRRRMPILLIVGVKADFLEQEWPQPSPTDMRQPQARSIICTSSGVICARLTRWGVMVRPPRL